jgi:hypothetical protein
MRCVSSAPVSNLPPPSPIPAQPLPAALPQFRGLGAPSSLDALLARARSGPAAPPAQSSASPTPPSMEPVQQSIATLRTLASVFGWRSRDRMDTKEEFEEGSGREYKDDDSPSFQVGQNVDVLDTVSNWLPSRIADVRPGEVFIHYIDWPSRWDEWLPCDSPRIQPFRTRTAQALNHEFVRCAHALLHGIPR